MIISKLIDRRQLTKALNSMYYYNVTLIFDSESDYIRIIDNKSEIKFKVEQST